MDLSSSIKQSCDTKMIHNN